jgi:hypothetical protein
MRCLRSMTMVMAMSLIYAAAAPAALAAPAFVNGLALDGARLDRSGGTDANTGRVGYFSDIYYDPTRGHWWALSDRGPGGGALHYETRVQRFRLKIDRSTGAISGFKIVKTIIFKDESRDPLDGMAPDPTNELGNAFDPEGFVVHPKTGHFLVSDEYGPSLYEFNRHGILVRTFTTPDNLLPRDDGGTPNYAGGDPEPNTAGRRTNRGFEGLAISPDGAYVYAMLQSAMLDEGSGDGVCNRIVKFDTKTGTAVAQYAYQMEGSSQGRGISALLAVNDHEFLVLERNNRGIGVGADISPPNKKVYPIDLDGAADVSDISLNNTNCPDYAVAKTGPFLDLAANTLPVLGNKVPEKWEGLAIGPRLKGGYYLMLAGTDNDYSVTQNAGGEQFDVYFRLTDPDPYLTSIFCPLGKTTDCFFHNADDNPEATLTPDYKLLPGVLHAYKVRRAELGNYVRPIPHDHDHRDDDEDDDEDKDKDKD